MPKISKDKFTNYILDQHPDCFFVNKDLDLLYISGDLEDFFTLPTALAHFNIEKMVPSSQLSFFRDAVKKVSEKKGVQRYQKVPFNNGDNVVIADFTFEIIAIEDMKDEIILGTITRDSSLSVIEKKVTENALLKPNERITSLENELKHYQRELRKSENAQKSRVEEINFQNRGMIASNEELQSTNEELQSVNEELHTVNSELQHKIKELTTANNDINNLLKSTDIGTIFLDNTCRIRKFTPAIKKQFDLVKADKGRPISAFSNRFDEKNLEQLCHSVIDEGKAFKKLVRNADEEEFLMRISPYRTYEKEIVGVVITFVDLSKTKSMLQEFDKSIQDTAHKLNAILENSKSPLIFIDPEFKVLEVNKRLANIRTREMKGKRFDQLIPTKYQEELAKKLRKIFSKDESQTINVDFDDGEFSYLLNLIPIQDPDDESKVGSACIIATENTDTMTYLRTLEQTRDTYMSFMENAQHQMVLLDQFGVIVNINVASKSPFTREQLIGTCIYDQLPPGEVTQYKNSIEKIFNGGSQSNISFKYIDMDKQENDVSVIASPVVVGERVVYVALVGDPL